MLRCGAPDARAHAAGALRNLSAHDENKPGIGDLTGAVEALVTVARDGNAAARANARAALSNLGRVQKHAKTIDWSGGGAVR